MACNEYAIAGKKLYAFKNADPKAVDTKQEWKTASKGTKLTPEQIVAIAQGQSVTYRPDVPTFSVHRERPIFIDRTVRNTA